MATFAIVPWQEKTTCCECGLEFASSVISKRRNDGEWFFCPNGHRQHFTETEEARLRKELERTKRDLEWQKSQRQTADERRQHAQKALIAQRGHTTRAKKRLDRVQNGVCPCCNRSFTNLRRHMETKHKRQA